MMREMEDNALEDIREGLRITDNPVVAFSGGKDSEVILHLARQIDDSIPAVWCNTGVEAPETRKRCRSVDNLIELHPETTFWRVAEKYGYPTVKGKDARQRIGHCCHHLKDKPMKKFMKENNIDCIIDGLTQSESHQRAMFLNSYGPVHYVKSWKCVKVHPIAKWTVKQVWSYIHHYEIPYNKKYDMGSKRIGCMTATCFINWQEVMLREYPQLEKVITRRMGIPRQSQLTEAEWEGCQGGA